MGNNQDMTSSKRPHSREHLRSYRSLGGEYGGHRLGFSETRTEAAWADVLTTTTEAGQTHHPCSLLTLSERVDNGKL